MKVGDRVRATKRITEGGLGYDGDPNATFPDVNYIHAEAGDEGTVIGAEKADPLSQVEEDVTVKFDRTGTATLVDLEGKDVELL